MDEWWGSGDTPVLFTMGGDQVVFECEEPWVGADVDRLAEIHPSWSRWFVERVAEGRV